MLSVLIKPTKVWIDEGKVFPGVRWYLFPHKPYPMPSNTSCLGLVVPYKLKKKKEGYKWDSKKNIWKYIGIKEIVEHSNDALDRGNEIHEIAETYIKTGNCNPGSYKKEIEGLKNILKKYGYIEPLLCEVPLFHKEWGWAGRLDSLLRCKYGNLLVDYKTGYDYSIKTGEQMAGNKMMVESQFPDIKVDGLVGIHLSPIKCNDFAYSGEGIKAMEHGFIECHSQFKRLYYNYLQNTGIQDPDDPYIKYTWPIVEIQRNVYKEYLEQEKEVNNV